MIKYLYWSACDISDILVRFYLNSNYLAKFSKNAQISNLMKISPVGAEFHANRRMDGQTGRHDEANSRF
jgi:hypothetical protein